MQQSLVSVWSIAERVQQTMTLAMAQELWWLFLMISMPIKWGNYPSDFNLKSGKFKELLNKIDYFFWSSRLCALFNMYACRSTQNEGSNLVQKLRWKRQNCSCCYCDFTLGWGSKVLYTNSTYSIPSPYSHWSISALNNFSNEGIKVQMYLRSTTFSQKKSKHFYSKMHHTKTRQNVRIKVQLYLDPKTFSRQNWNQFYWTFI